MHALCSNISALLASGPLVLVSIITQSGSAPRTAGARMLALPDGGIRGTIGGGRYEAEAMREAMDLMKNGGSARSMFFSLNKAGDMDMICGGDILVLLEHLEQSERNIVFFAQAAQAEQEGKNFAIVAQLDFPIDEMLSPSPRRPINNGAVTRHLALRGDNPPSLPHEIGPHLAQAWVSAAPFARLAGGCMWLFEPFPPAERIHIIGGGHVSLALARLAESVSFSSTVLDDRAEFISEARFPYSRRVQPLSLAEGHMDEYFAETRPGERDAVVIVTRGHAFDRDALAAALRTKAGYIGMIGSSSKRKQVYGSLLQSGFTQEDLARVYSPIGLDIGAQTPEEIAVSIMGELIQWRHEAR